ncbi:hypothetical protein [Pedobacter antarcticus]|uniref:hypothetical protein n=1 Tax=Pedobacter antarcticus TaxID=34086 RepID=UPI001C566E28|nr:hypothetical protein [Pedobacter antarcticus]
MATVTKNFRFLLKFGEQDHMTDLIEKGILYCNTISYFRKLEDPKQGDKHEGCLSATPVIINKIISKDGRINMPDIKINGVLRDHDSEFNRNIFCLYGPDEYLLQRFIDKEIPVLVNRREFDFGKYFIFIKDPNEFAKRVKIAIEKEKYQYKLSFIEYVDQSTYQGKMGIFKKSDYYKDQNELRFSIESNSDQPIKLNIGNMRDIAEGPYPIDEIEKLELKIYNN